MKIIKQISTIFKTGIPTKFIEGIDSGYSDLKLRALLYYKTAGINNDNLIKDYSHTNFWEVTEIVKILNKAGFIVDVVDRSNNDFIPEDKYDLFIGLAAGNSGKHFVKYAGKLTKAIKIAYVLGPEPALSTKLVFEQYARFNQRTGLNAPAMRAPDKIDFEEINKFTDYIFCFGHENTFSFNSYKKFNKPLEPIMPGISPDVHFSPDWLRTRNRKSFLCFAGNGFICKGVDILVEAFLKMPDYKLTICGPNNEKAFFDAYGKAIEESPNIEYKGFIEIGGKAFEELCRTCSYVIFYSSSEGCATSVATAMRSGMVPVVNRETSIEVSDFGYIMTNYTDRIQDVVDTVKMLDGIGEDEYKERVYKTLIHSVDYSQEGFTMSFTKAILEVMLNERKRLG